MNTEAVRQHVARATFTDPEVAQAGLTEAEARERVGDKTLVSRWPLGEVDRALTDGEADGFVKAVHQRSGAILGATVVAPRAGEMIHEWTLAIERGIKLGDLARSIHVYPTYSMATQQLALRVLSEKLQGGRMGGVAAATGATGITGASCRTTLRRGRCLSRNVATRAMAGFLLNLHDAGSQERLRAAHHPTDSDERLSTCQA